MGLARPIAESVHSRITKTVLGVEDRFAADGIHHHAVRFFAALLSPPAIPTSLVRYVFMDLFHHMRDFILLHQEFTHQRGQMTLFPSDHDARYNSLLRVQVGSF